MISGFDVGNERDTGLVQVVLEYSSTTVLASPQNQIVIRGQRNEA